MAATWTYRGWIVKPRQNWFMGRHWRIEPDPDVDRFPRTCSAMEIPVNSYRERARARDAIDRDRADAAASAQRKRDEMAKTKTVTTRKGKKLSLGRYLSLFQANEARGVEHACTYGHFGCAAWEGGPCHNEVLSELPEGD